MTRAALALAGALAFTVPSPGSAQLAPSDHLTGLCSGYTSVVACLDALFGSDKWRRWKRVDYNEYAQAMGLARWKGGEKWKGCDSLNHFASETVFPNTEESRFLIPGTADRPAFRFHWAHFPPPPAPPAN